MSAGRSDASTSTDDVKGRPLCLFYFTHPFGVLSPEPPTVAAAPPQVARAFINMEPVPPHTFRFWSTSASTDDSYNTNTSDSAEATAPTHPLNVVRVARSSRSSLSSSLLSSDVWLDSGSSCRSNELGRRVVPYNTILPPLHLPHPKYVALDSPEEWWPKRGSHPEKFSLPPIEMPSAVALMPPVPTCDVESEHFSNRDNCIVKDTRSRRAMSLGVRKQRRVRRVGHGRSAIVSLMRRAVRGRRDVGSSPALQEALSTIREAWPEPTSLFDRLVGPKCEAEPHDMGVCTQVADAAWAPAASPGLMRRRYSVPEIIMRKYRLAQQRTEADEPAPTFCRTPASASASVSRESPGESPHRFARRDRELMRKSALLRRLWGRGAPEAPPPCCRCVEVLEAEASCCRETRSLDGSRSELRPLSGWAPAKRQRLDEDVSPGLREGSDVILTLDPYPDTEVSKLYEVQQQPEEALSDVTTIDIGSDFVEEGSVRLSSLAPRSSMAELSYGDLTDSFSYLTSTAKPRDGCEPIPPNPTEKGSSKGHIRGQIRGCSIGVDNDDRALPYDTPLSIETSSYEVLEIVVSETSNSCSTPGASRPPRLAPVVSNAPLPHLKHRQNINIDEYVSNILVESLNSLSDQLESMNASIGNDRKLSIVEKEIKVKLQNTGVNTIVHLSPTSNNQIIFGNEELCNDGERDACNNPREARDSLTIREEPPSPESNNNLASVGSGDAADDHAFPGVVNHEAVNKAVLQQIQKLFQDELQNSENDGAFTSKGAPEISHIEISNVDVYIDNNTPAGLGTTNAIEMHTSRNDADINAIAGVGTGNYYCGADERVLVPRFSAFPHTESMEVNTSSSDDAELVGSDCTSLVDSLDDPNSPRSVLLRRSVNGRRSELVRSAIDVLDLLPESASLSKDNTPTRDKGETFFIRIKDDECDCEKENINVADHMPEKIKQRLYKRQKKRELRMEYTRRSKVRQLKRDIEKRRSSDRVRNKREVEKECMAIINSLIDDVISRIAQEEYACMRIKKRPTRLPINKLDESSSKKHRQAYTECLKPTPTAEIGPLRPAPGVFKSNTHNVIKENHKSLRHQIHGKLSLVTRPSPTTEERDRGPQRIYQKQEIHEGNKFIEILEILEYVNGSRSSPDTSPSDENHNYHQKNKKSRIPVPVHDKLNRIVKAEHNTCNKSADTAPHEKGPRPSPPKYMAPRIANEGAKRSPDATSAEPRARRASLGFKRSFDVIPEERTSLSIESSDGEREKTRRQSAPCSNENNERPHDPIQSPMRQRSEDKVCKSVGTSPFLHADEISATGSSKNRSTMTSPTVKSAATSPLRGSQVARRDPRRSIGSLPAGPDEEENVGSSKSYGSKSFASTGRGSDGAKRPYRPPLKGEPVEQRPEHRKSNKAQRVSAAAEDKPTEMRKSRSRRTGEDRGGGGGPRRATRSMSMNGQDELRLPECRGSSSDSGESAGSLLCSLAPKWLSTHARQRRNVGRRGFESAPSTPPSVTEPNVTGGERDAGEWSVTVAGSCRAALPADVEMRLRFPQPSRVSRPREGTEHYQECSCRPCAACACSACVEHEARPKRMPPLPPAHPPDGKLTLTMKKEALDSSILASRSTKKSTVPLPEVETYAAARSKLRSSVKTRRGYSLHCWLPDDAAAPARATEGGLSVLGCAIVPELKPRVPTMSERDLTRAYTPRHYLRS